MDILKGVQYFTKNIVIQPVPIEFKTEKNQIYTYEKESNKSEKDRSRKSNVNISSDKRTKSVSNERRSWESEHRFGEEPFLGIRSSDQTNFSEDMLKNMDLDENVKFYHKEITIKPVYIPPPKFEK